jgi:hypothetical protein
MLTTLPYVGLVAAAKWALEYVVVFPGWFELGEVSVVLTAGVFLTGFMLAGTMADYKESEKLPGEVACTLETMEEILFAATVIRPNIQPQVVRKAVLEAGTQLKAWLLRSVSHEGMFTALTKLGETISQVERDGGGAYASKALSELHSLRKSVTRIGVISRTGFLPPAYAILETLTVMIIVLLLCARFKGPLSEFILVPFVTLIYVYMLRLIKDIDDPFEYAADGSKQGGAEVELFPLEEYLARLKTRVG